MSVRGQDTKLSEVALRVGERSDVSYMFSRTLADWRNSPEFQGMPDRLYHQYVHRALEHTMTRAVTWVAYPAPVKIKMEGSTMIRSSNRSTILGYIIADPTNIGLVVHYMNVRRTFNDHGTMTEDYRRLGIGRKLAETMIKEYKLPEKVIWTLLTPMWRHEREWRHMVREHPQIERNSPLFWTLLPHNWETGIRKPSQQFMAEIVG